ncbi:HNH endonuclease [Salmonella enterica]|nr:HNH endonuclease [Salmonella enterica]ELN9276987.1 HNH endonuclease [Salmonella enterica]
MDHNKIYNLIIANAKGRPKAVGLETHHIIPRCVGGTNDESNLVNLTRREHFVCHRLLARNGGKLELSFRMIRNRTRSGNSREYDIARLNVTNVHRQYKHSEETKIKMSGWNHTEDAKRRISDKTNNRGKNPWEVTNANTNMWLYAGEAYEHWLTGKGYTRIMKLLPLSQMTAQTMTKKFKSGWVPLNDQDWVKFKEDHTDDPQP